MPLDNVRVTSRGGPGGNGYTNFYFGVATPANLTALGAFFTALKLYIPSTITYTIPSSGNTISELNGKLIATWSAAAPAAITGTSANSGSDLSGVLVAWAGATIVDSHRPEGKTMLVPMGTNVYAGDGSIAPAVVTAVNNAAATFLTSSAGFAIWHRPIWDRDASPPVLVRPGSTVAVASGVCRPYPTVLRSRRS